MDDDGQVISFEEAARRRRALQDDERERGGVHEVKLSDAMTHLLDDEAAAPAGDEPAGRPEEHPTPEDLRRIVERDFTDDAGRFGREPEERPGPHLVEDRGEDHGGQLCSFETRRCWDPEDFPEGPPPD